MLTLREKDIDATMKVIVFIEMVEPVLLSIGAINTREWTSEQAWTRPDLIVALVLTCSAFTLGLFSLVSGETNAKLLEEIGKKVTPSVIQSIVK